MLKIQQMPKLHTTVAPWYCAAMEQEDVFMNNWCAWHVAPGWRNSEESRIPQLELGNKQWKPVCQIVWAFWKLLLMQILQMLVPNWDMISLLRIALVI